MKTIDQKCAESAFKAFKALNKEGDKKDLFGYAKKMPMRILNSGLGNAIMFKYEKCEKLHKHLFKWLKGSKLELNSLDELVPSFMSSRDELRLNTIKALQWLDWFNRFAATEKE